MNCPSLVSCDPVDINVSGGKLYVPGAFNAIVADAVPHRRPFVVQFAAADLAGPVAFAARVVRLETGEESGLFQSRTYRVRGPEVVPEEQLPLDATFAAFGRYRVGLSANGHELAWRVLELVDATGGRGVSFSST